MKYAALINGADVAPISSTLGISAGIGVVSTRTLWLNLSHQLAPCFFLFSFRGRLQKNTTHRGSLWAILVAALVRGVSWGVRVVVGSDRELLEVCLQVGICLLLIGWRVSQRGGYYQRALCRPLNC